MPWEPPTLEIDAWEKRQSPRDFAPRLEKLCAQSKIPCETTHLTTGDIRFLSSSAEIVLIERKSTAGDLYQSTAQRLIAQCLRLLDEADVPILLIDGPLQIGGDYFKAGRYKTGWRFSSVTHRLLTLQQRGLILIYVPKMTQTPREVVALYRYFQEETHDSVLRPIDPEFPLSRHGLTNTERRMQAVMAAHGVGPELARRLLKVYGSVPAIGCADVEGLAAIPGIGDKIAQSIKAVLGGGVEE